MHFILLPLNKETLFRKFQMRLHEIVSTTASYDIIKSTSTNFTTMAKIGKRFIRFSAKFDGEQGWDVVFEELDSPSDKRPTYSKTGQGREFEVFSMVASSFKEFIERYQPELITFTADKEGDESRARLYRKLIEKYLKGWTATEIDGGSAIHFSLYRETD